MRWDTIPTPGSVPSSGLTSMPGSYDVLSPGGGEIIDYAVGASGTVAAIVCMDPPEFGGVPQNVLLGSKDYGLSWNDSFYNIMQNQGWGAYQIVHITISPDDPAVWAMTVATSSLVGPTLVYYTDEAGIHWVDTELVLPAGETIRSIDISPLYADGVRDIGVTTVTGAGAGSFYVHSSKNWGAWKNQGAGGSVLPLASGNADYFDIKFSPSYGTDSSVALVYATAAATYFNVGFRDINLNTTLSYAFPAGVEVKNSSSAANASPGLGDLNTTCLQLPSDFTGLTSTLRRAYISLDVSAGTKAVGTCEDGIIRIDDTHTYSLMDTTKTLDKSIYSIAYYGTYTQGKLLAGERLGYPCSATVPTWFTDSPTTCPIPCWYPALKPATGAAAQGNCVSGTKDGIGACRVVWDEYGALAFAGTGALAEQTGANWWSALYGPPLINDEAAFAISRNNGETWNEVGLINTTIDWFNDVAPTLDCSTIYLASSNRNTGLAGVCNEFDSVWRTTINPKIMMPLPMGPHLGFYWERVLTHTTSDSCAEAQSDRPLLRLPMECDDRPDGEVVAWAAQLTATQLWSPDYGDFWASIQARESIQDFAFETSSIIYNLTPGGLVQKMTFSGTEWSTKARSYDSRVGNAHTIAVIPKGKVLVGAAADGMYVASYSATGGEQWIEIPKNAALLGNVHVTFDSDFANNKFVYLADDMRDENGAKITTGIAGSVFREEVPAYIRLEDGDMMAKANSAHATVDWPATAGGITLDDPPHQIGQFGIVSAKTGDPQPALYSAHDNITTTLGRDNSAVCRTLKPWQPMPKYGVGWDCLDIFSPVTQENVKFTLEPSSLKYCGCCTLDSYTTLFALDNQSNGVFNGGIQTPSVAGYTPAINQGMLWAYTDCLAKQPPVILLPPDGGFIGSDPVTGRNQQVDLSWEQLCLGIRYDLEIYKDRQMTMKVNPAITNPGGIAIITAVTGQITINLDEYNVTNPHVWLPPGTLPEAGASYFWRVRVTRSSTGQLAISPWTEIRNFSIKPGFIVNTPVLGVELLSPDNSCQACPVEPTALSWTPYKEATKYEVNLAKDPAFMQVIKRTTTTSTAYQYEDMLEHSKSYYWRVRVTEINGKSNVGDWSSVFTFTTVSAPKPEPVKTQRQLQEEQFGPNYLWIVILVVILVPVAMLVLIIMTRRSRNRYSDWK
ncbi:MAG: hypothetical protein JXA01_07390 [Dehalococcoidia bacterium]|nr:hypothetical protein [Dehalococcoidia bacterium]